MFRYRNLFVIILIYSSMGVVTSSHAQDSIVDQDVRVNEQFWIDYNFSKMLDESRDISTQIGFRTISPKVYNRFIGISTLNLINHSNLKVIQLINSFHLGVGVLYTSNYNANDNIELRLIQGFKFHIHAIKPIPLHNYVRLEERLQNSFGDGWTVGYRLRYRLSTEIQWGQHLFDFTQGLYFPLSAELFVNLKKADRYNDLIRLSPGIGYKLKSGWKMETYLIFNSTKNNTETNNTSNDFILRIRIKDERNKRVGNAPRTKIPIENGE